VSARQTRVLLALQDALDAAFRADPALVALVGGRIHDGTPKAAVTPWLAFAEATARDWSSGDGTGVRAALTLEAVATDAERGRALDIVDAAAAIAVAAPLVLGHGTLVLIRANGAGVDRLRDGRSWRARITLEALVDG
jgi:hypothetical protein